MPPKCYAAATEQSRSDAQQIKICRRAVAEIKAQHGLWFLFFSNGSSAYFDLLRVEPLCSVAAA